jgi:hypothetical protein
MVVVRDVRNFDQASVDEASVDAPIARIAANKLGIAGPAGSGRIG